MKISVKRFIFIPVCILSNILWAQGPVQTIEETKGIISSQKLKAKVTKFSNIPFFKSPDASLGQDGELLVVEDDNKGEVPQLILKNSHSDILDNIGSEVFSRLKDDVFGLRFSSIHNGFLRLDLKDRSVWIAEEDLNKKNLIHLSWMDLLQKEEWKTTGWLPGLSEIGVHGGAGKGHRVILNVYGDLYRIRPLGKSNGNWFYVNVIKFKEQPCNSSLSELNNSEFEFKGWINLFNEKGNPSVEFSSSDCN